MTHLSENNQAQVPKTETTASGEQLKSGAAIAWKKIQETGISTGASLGKVAASASAKTSELTGKAGTVAGEAAASASAKTSELTGKAGTVAGKAAASASAKSNELAGKAGIVAGKARAAMGKVTSVALDGIGKNRIRFGAFLQTPRRLLDKAILLVGGLIVLTVLLKIFF